MVHRVRSKKLYQKLIVIFVLQISLTDVFLGGAFSNFGLAAATWSDIEAEDRMDPMIEVFPRYAFTLIVQSPARLQL